MELIELENIAEREKIDIVNFKMKNVKARIINYGHHYIFMNYSKIDTYEEEKCLLAEELGHYYYDAYYTLNNINQDKTIVDKQEYRAQKWKIKTLIPVKQLTKLVEEGFQYSYEIADELGVTEELVRKAYNYYKENNMIKCY